MPEATVTARGKNEYLFKVRRLGDACVSPKNSANSTMRDSSPDVRDDFSAKLAWE